MMEWNGEWRDVKGNIHKVEEMETKYIINAMRFAQNRLESLEDIDSKISSMSTNGNVVYNMSDETKMKMEYLKGAVEAFKVELRERRLNQLINKNKIDDLDIGLDGDIISGNNG